MVTPQMTLVVRLQTPVKYSYKTATINFQPLDVDPVNFYDCSSLHIRVLKKNLVDIQLPKENLALYSETDLILPCVTCYFPQQYLLELIMPLFSIEKLERNFRF